MIRIPFEWLISAPGAQATGMHLLEVPKVSPPGCGVPTAIIHHATDELEEVAARPSAAAGTQFQILTVKCDEDGRCQVRVALDGQVATICPSRRLTTREDIRTELLRIADMFGVGEVCHG